ncbi:MAG TPA: LLM class flavin-dependent oxidoreductase [Candidatus Limnocylindria bacterium]|nr:LLM class flavin-dependent oxidoreductase [Candidatus Limnocylindria bacterium]
MKFTFDLPTSLWREPSSRFVELARPYEAAGFDRFGVADWRFYPDLFVHMTACLMATERLELESLVTDPFVRHPALTACAMATMDDLSRGRVVLGLGGGLEQPAFWHQERVHPLDAVRDTVEIARRMLRGERVTYRGRVLSVDGAKLGFRPFRPDLPILVAARGKRMIELAGELADVVHLAAFFMGVEHRREEIAHVRAGADRAGRRMGSFEIDITMPCSVSEDRAAARRAAKRPAAQGILWMAGAEKYSRQRADWRPPKEFRVPDHVVGALAKWDFWTQPYLPAELADLITDDVLDQFALAGTPGECAQRVRAIARELPDVTGVRLYALPPPSDSWSGGYIEMARAMGKLISLVRSG